MSPSAAGDRFVAALCMRRLTFTNQKQMTSPFISPAPPQHCPT